MRFFLWGYVKDRVYQEIPTTIENMQDRIRQAFNEITPETLTQVKRHFIDRLNLCVRENGHAFEHLNI